MFVAAGETTYDGTSCPSSDKTYAFVRILKNNGEKYDPLVFGSYASGGRFVSATHVKFATFTGSKHMDRKPANFIFTYLKY